MTRNHAVVIVVALLCLTVLVWGIFIWPSLYRYEKVTRPWYRTTKQEVYRINRVTGQSEKVVDPVPSRAENE